MYKQRFSITADVVTKRRIVFNKQNITQWECLEYLSEEQLSLVDDVISGLLDTLKHNLDESTPKPFSFTVRFFIDVCISSMVITHSNYTITPKVHTGVIGDCGELYEDIHPEVLMREAEVKYGATTGIRRLEDTLPPEQLLQPGGSIYVPGYQLEIGKQNMNNNFDLNEATVTITLNDLMRDGKLDTINSITKYPSIYTYHALKRGVFAEPQGEGFSPDEELIVTEKVDGTNARIIFYKGDYLIGSREDILYAKGDRIINPSLSICETIIKYADELSEVIENSTDLIVVYGEVYGGKVGSMAKAYSGDRELTGYAVFDISVLSEEEFMGKLSLDLPEIAGWRQRDRDRFIQSDGHFFNALVDVMGCGLVDKRVFTKPIPEDSNEILAWLNDYCESNMLLDDKGNGKSEGVVVRNKSGSLIYKFRFEDYEGQERRIAEAERIKDRLPKNKKENKLPWN